VRNLFFYIIDLFTLLLLASATSLASGYYNLASFWRNPSFTMDWPFTTLSDYTPGTNIQITNGVASLAAYNQDNDNTSFGFGGGTASSTGWDSTNSWYTLSGTNTSGLYTSRVMDAGSSVSWSSLNWVPVRPMYKELPKNASCEFSYRFCFVYML
jgi:hypothetical protein